jgi:hypothetical protein
MVNTELRNFVLTEAVTSIGTPQLNLNVDTYTRFTNSQGVPEGVAPQTKRPGVSRTASNNNLTVRIQAPDSWNSGAPEYEKVIEKIKINYT